MKIGVMLSLFVALLAMPVYAQEEQEEVPVRTFVERLTDNGNKSEGVVIVNQESRIQELIERHKKIEDERLPMTTVSGWRVQVFSSNQTDAKVKSLSVKDAIKAKYPNLPVYVSYRSPFWKVRIGDYTSNTDAQYLKEELRKDFPEFSNETYVVKDKVKIPQ